MVRLSTSEYLLLTHPDTRNGHITTNTLAACDPQLRFIYLLPGWEGSAGYSRILRDAVSRPLGLKVPKGDIFAIISTAVSRVTTVYPAIHHFVAITYKLLLPL